MRAKFILDYNIIEEGEEKVDVRSSVLFFKTVRALLLSHGGPKNW